MPKPPQADLSFDAIDRAIDAALACDALQRIRTEQLGLEDGGIRFLVRWISSLARKDEAKIAAAGRRGPDFNPFLPPEPALTLGPIGKHHLVVLNKYPVIARHLLIVTRAFEDQHAPLTPADFDAMAAVLQALGGIGFYNGGTEAGASQQHKHLQWIPETPDGPGLARFTAGLPGTGAPREPPLAPSSQSTFQPLFHPAVPLRHVFIRLGPTLPNGQRLHDAFIAACTKLGIAATANPMRPYNLIIDRDWMLVVPRSCERHLDISINALGFAGSLFVSRPEQIDLIREIGPLRLLAGVAERD